MLLNYLLKNGSEKVVTSSREHLYDIRSLETFSFVDENGKDQGINSKFVNLYAIGRLNLHVHCHFWRELELWVINFYVSFHKTNGYTKKISQA